MENNLTIKDYSDKAIAVYGQTKEHKDALKEMGGRFNPRLKDGAGWVFSKSKADAVKAYIASKYGTAYIQPTPTDEVKDTPSTITPAPAACSSAKKQKGSTKRNTKVIMEGWVTGELVMPNSKVEKYVKDTVKAKQTFFDQNPDSELPKRLKITFVQL
jgi:hypothetical protein